MIRSKLLLFLVMISFQTCAQVESGTYNAMLKTILSHSVPEVSIKKLKDMIDVTLLDAREPAEFGVSHIANAISIGYDQFNVGTVKNLDKNSKIVVYCSVGYRSEKIAEKLKKEGFTHVSNLYGGIFEWVNQGNPVIDSNGQFTKRVHGYSKSWGIWLNKGEKVY